MKKLLSIILLLLCLNAGATTVTLTLTVTNNPGNGYGVTNLSFPTDIRRWTNSLTTNATQILIASGNINNASNLFFAIQANPFQGMQVQWDGTSNVTLFGLVVSVGITNSLTQGWASLVYVTNTTALGQPVIANATGLTAALQGNTASQTAMASGIIAGINANATNAFQTNTTAMAKFVDLQNAQNLGNKFITNSIVSNSVVTNSILSGKVANLTNGIFTSQTNLNPLLGTNDLNDLTGWTAWSFGSDVSGNFQSVPFRFFVVGGVVYLDTGSTNAPATLAANFIGSGQMLTALTASNIVNGKLLGPFTVTNSGNLFSGTFSNLITAGTNGLNGAIYSTRFNNTALANGANAGVSTGTNVFIKVSGPSSAFTINGMAGGLDDRIVAIENSTGQQITIANDSGVDPTATNRIYTGTGADLVSTNNPSFFMFKYDASVTHWRLMFASGSPSSGGSGTFSGSFTGNGGGLTNVTSPTFSAYRAGFQAIGNLATSQAVTFTTPLASAVGTNYAVSISSDSTLASAVGFSAGSKTTNGFTITLSAGVAGGIGVDYSAIPYQ